MANDQTPTIKLDWSRLLGFDQALRPSDHKGAAGLAGPLLAKLGSKVGVKKGIRLAV